MTRIDLKVDFLNIKCNRYIFYKFLPRSDLKSGSGQNRLNNVAISSKFRSGHHSRFNLSAYTDLLCLVLRARSPGLHCMNDWLPTDFVRIMSLKFRPKANNFGYRILCDKRLNSILSAIIAPTVPLNIGLGRKKMTCF